MRANYDLTGKTFGYITVVAFDSRDRFGKSIWQVRCKCGNEKKMKGYSLTSGNTRSCGCAHREFMKAAIGKQSGGLTGAKWYAITSNAKARNHEVKITQAQAARLFEKQNRKCALTGVDLVLDAPRQAITASLDRIDSARPYELDNVRWVHKIVNRMKNTLSDTEFLYWIKLLATFAPVK